MYSKGFQEPCHGAGAPESKVRLLHRARYATIMRLRERGVLYGRRKIVSERETKKMFLITGGVLIGAQE